MLLEIECGPYFFAAALSRTPISSPCLLRLSCAPPPIIPVLKFFCSAPPPLLHYYRPPLPLIRNASQGLLKPLPYCISPSSYQMENLAIATLSSGFLFPSSSFSSLRFFFLPVAYGFSIHRSILIPTPIHAPGATLI